MTVRIRRKLESETLHLPELRPLIGKNVEIIVLEESQTAVTSSADGWDDALKAVQALDDYDFDAVQRQREYDLKHAKDHLP